MYTGYLICVAMLFGCIAFSDASAIPPETLAESLQSDLWTGGIPDSNMPNRRSFKAFQGMRGKRYSTADMATGDSIPLANMHIFDAPEEMENLRKAIRTMMTNELYAPYKRQPMDRFLGMRG